MLKVPVDGEVFRNFEVELRAHAQDVLVAVQEEMKRKLLEETGGVLHVYVSDTPLEGRRHYHEIARDRPRSHIGFMPSTAMWSRYQNNAREKALRLMWKHKTDGHLTSRQSANEDAGEYGGAIIIPNINHPAFGDELTFLLSFSGFPQDYDEMFCFLLAERLRLTNELQTNKALLVLATYSAANWPFLQMRRLTP